jgi:hypothetical protein
VTQLGMINVLVGSILCAGPLFAQQARLPRDVSPMNLLVRPIMRAFAKATERKNIGCLSCAHRSVCLRTKSILT